ncbi:Asparaginase [Penicillium ucsense]|uniref:Asparaginase n=1 Tax=Penicillium ucsense TaxID=2839758 RepID=A0A8J8WLW0_9EURO|nr:Asparaginase [Penicillium ucsense]KAF7739331.1 Asparaginase [Penicillium ucsense]
MKKPLFKPRVVIHGGAGNILRQDFQKEEYEQYRTALLSIVSKTNEYMTQRLPGESDSCQPSTEDRRPSALDIATYAVTLLEDHPLFNSGHGSVFTRDGTNELEASVMVSVGLKKRCVGVMGVRNVKNPVILARKILEHGEQDLEVENELEPRSTSHTNQGGPARPSPLTKKPLDVPSAQGHTLIHGEAAEILASKYGCEVVPPSYYFTQKRWNEHIQALDKEKRGESLATWDPEEYLPQGTCGAVAMDEHGVICAATSTGGLTNKISGRIGDTPIPGAGFWAGQWDESSPSATRSVWYQLPQSSTGLISHESISTSSPGLWQISLPIFRLWARSKEPSGWSEGVTSIRSIGLSGTGTGDSFVRTAAAQGVLGLAQWKPETGSNALKYVAGADGILQQSAGDRWGKTGEGEGGMIGIESMILRDKTGEVVGTKSMLLMDYNCAGMYRAWVDDSGQPRMSIWTNGAEDDEAKKWFP